MPYFVQYDNTTGEISGIVFGQHAPNHPHQLTLQDPVDPHTKKVDLETMTLVDLPPPASNIDIPQGANEAQFLSDRERYILRAEAKAGMLATLAAGNMSRIRSGTWTVPQLVGIMQDSVVMQILTDIDTLSFELAYSKVDLVTNSLITTQIKSEWKKLLMDNFYNS